MAITVTTPGDFFSRAKSVFGFAAVPIAFSGNYSTGGDTLNLAGAIPSKLAPLAVFVKGQSGFEYEYVAGADATSGKVKVFSGYAVELSAGAYPAAQTGDTVTALVIYKPNV